MKWIFILIMGLVWGMGFSYPVDATLVDRGNGLIYDTDFQITWLADANYPRTSGYDSDGLLDRASAQEWVEGLVYGGYGDWRLPVTRQPDPSCDGQSGGISWSGNCTGSEMGHLFYTELGGWAGSSITGSSDPDLALFLNLTPAYYWSSTQYAPGSSAYWDFGFGDGLQRAGNVPDAYALAVRSGDVSSGVPETETMLLMSAGLVGVAVWRRQRHLIGTDESSVC